MLNTSPVKRLLVSGFYQRKSRPLFYCILLCSITFSVWAKTPESAIGWIKKMVQATHGKNYNQTFIYENQSGITTIKLSHANLDGHEYEKLIFLNGPRREFIRKDNHIMTLHSDQNKSIEGLPAPKAIPFSGFPINALDELQQLYLFSERGYDRIAGYPCIRISVQPKDSFRYGYELWIDKKTGLLLRVDLLDEKKLVLDRFMVTQISFPDNPTVQDFPLHQQHIKKSPTANHQTKSQPFPWNISWLPMGFASIGSNITKSPVNNEIVHYISYSDGLSSFSVYVEKDTSHILSQSVDKFGATSAVSRVFKTERGTYYNVTVIGELPLGAAERIAVSVQPHSPITGKPLSSPMEEKTTQ